MKIPYIWTKKLPTRAGFYWTRTEKCDPDIVYIFRDQQGHWSVRYEDLHLRDREDMLDLEGFSSGGVNYLCNEEADSEWSGPIPEPREPKEAS